MAAPVFQCGDDVTFTYHGSEVTYGTISITYNEGELDEYTLCWMDRNLGASQVATTSTDANAYGDLFQWGRLDDGHQDRSSSTTSTLSTTDVPGHSDFITVSDSPRDWLETQNDDLWQGGAADNNPCPPGWRVPTETEWAAELDSWGSSINGSLLDVGSYGFYWSSTVVGTDSRNLYFFNSPDTNMDHNNRAFGFSVRCLKE